MKKPKFLRTKYGYPWPIHGRSQPAGRLWPSWLGQAGRMVCIAAPSSRREGVRIRSMSQFPDRGQTRESPRLVPRSPRVAAIDAQDQRVCRSCKQVMWRLPHTSQHGPPPELADGAA
jgi:hypothetical protein